MKFVTFNCHGFKSSVYDILLLCEQFGVIIVQELWLSSDDISLLRSIRKTFEAYAVSAMNDQLGIQVGRPFVVLVFYGENRFHMLVQFVIYKITNYWELTLI